jgi:hypothetical protein
MPAEGCRFSRAFFMVSAQLALALAPLALFAPFALWDAAFAVVVFFVVDAFDLMGTSVFLRQQCTAERLIRCSSSLAASES